MKVLSSHITIGDFSFKGVNKVTVKKSIFQLGDTATIALPASSVLRTTTDPTQEQTTASVQTAKQFEVGDRVVIRLGYDDNLNQEFSGFVSRVNFTEPCVIECEGYSWILRNTTNIVASWKSTTLREVLGKVIEGTELKLHPLIPDMPLKNIVINNASGLQVVNYLKGLLKGALTVYFIDEVLYMGLAYQELADDQTVKYRLKWNTINADSLKYHRAIDLKVSIQLKFRNDAGQYIQTTTGVNGGVVKRETMSAITDLKTLEEIAQTKLDQESFDGYEGNMICFGEPFCLPGYRAEVTDPLYEERAGVFFVSATTVTFGMQGFRRNVTLGIQLTN